ncbi:hypothetical protein PENSPDRAFT_753343 [Peniophora sp. CONT]|nr:hypothetical protein PENSPDRAFT_753343 [Peniophora sp. CONT]
MAHVDKGKSREEEAWKPGWWQFSSLSEPQTPIVWTRHSTILMGHPTQPAVYGRAFPSSRPFIVPSPALVLSGTYGPPTNLSLCPDDKHLFAYFPPMHGPAGVACLWTREQADVWNVKECWLSTGCVTVTWLGAPREWAHGVNGPSRLPPRGPQLPQAIATVAVVSQDMQLHVCFIKRSSGVLSMLSCCLSYPDESTEDGGTSFERPTQGSEGVRICSVAAIGLSYNEDSLLVATVSRKLPHPVGSDPSLSLDISMGIDMTGASQVEPTAFNDWEKLGDDAVLEIAEARLGTMDGSAQLNLSTTPLSTVTEYTGNMSKLLFVPVAGKETPVKLYLVAFTTEDGDYCNPPITRLTTWPLARPPQSAKPTQSWAFGRQTTRSFTDEVVIFVHSHHAVAASSTLLVGTVQTEVQMPRSRRKGREVAIGHTTVLNALNLTENDSWQKMPLLVPADGIYQELPFDIALSPTGTLACSTCTASSIHLRVIIHPLPKLKSPPDHIEPEYTTDTGCATYVLQSRGPWDELAHRLGSTSMPLVEAERILFESTICIEGCVEGLRPVHEHDFLGLLVGVYRNRWRNTQSPEIKDELDLRWRTAHDMCSIMTTHKAFAFCKERENDDFEAVWQLIQLSNWFITFLQDLLRECSLLYDAGEAPDSSNDHLSPIFVNLLYPTCLRRMHTLVRDVKDFYEQLSQHKSIGENSQIAKHVLNDAVQCSGIKLAELDKALTAVAEAAKELDNPLLARSLAYCQPVPQLSQGIRSLAAIIVEAGAIDKPQLFINAPELISGFLHMDISNADTRQKDGQRDVVSKGLLLPSLPSYECLRCAGCTQVYANVGGKYNSKGWGLWERLWSQRCICGGVWTTTRGYAPILRP